MKEVKVSPIVAGAVVLVVIVILIYLLRWPPTGPSAVSSVVIDGNDISHSANKLCQSSKSWHLRLYNQLDPNSQLTFCQLASDNIPVVVMRHGLPQPDEFAMGFSGLLASDKRKGTRPLRFLEYVLALSKQYSEKQFVIAFFTDGQNDYREDDRLLEEVCGAIVQQPNIVRIGMFGLDPLDKRKVADWCGWFKGSDKAIICTRALKSTEMGINQFCNEVNRELMRLARAKKNERKGGK